MSHTYTALLSHVVFSTKDRVPSLSSDMRSAVHAYLGGIVRELGGKAVAIGGAEDHVHLLLELGADLAIAECLRIVKTNSSRWIHETWPGHRRFAWQRGYGAFTVSMSHVADVVAYIQRQEEHHHKRSFQEEFLALLRKHGVAFDERYIWT